ncbi:hypothetical protein [Mucilaginibacter gotjawali]|uniref:Uncharacterized protein n=2 Tax=Mucilaginibacter gotjawali TaxID=1550579 RepID=A0A0X8X3B1_9SPHI|nr:hypothetical protein [Mucilaginibacter gotjawali]MBB3056241.1 hypothetical protein [Mucilaginibacter gotjawali]BAU54945.1 hypothetical protein MgSA37_03125 [Mucilaginibacter gotjawali]
MNQLEIDIITNFVLSTGIDVVRRPIIMDTFLPGLLLENGEIIIDADKLLYPGGILHEAGHFAGYEPDVRETTEDLLPGHMAFGVK